MTRDDAIVPTVNGMCICVLLFLCAHINFLGFCFYMLIKFFRILIDVIHINKISLGSIGIFKGIGDPETKELENLYSKLF